MQKNKYQYRSIFIWEINAKRNRIQVIVGSVVGWWLIPHYVSWLVIRLSKNVHLRPNASGSRPLKWVETHLAAPQCPNHLPLLLAAENISRLCHLIVLGKKIISTTITLLHLDSYETFRIDVIVGTRIQWHPLITYFEISIAVSENSLHACWNFQIKAHSCRRKTISKNEQGMKIRITNKDQIIPIE